MIQESKNLKVMGNDYVIPFPNVGQYMAIEAMKMSLTDDRYGAMLKAKTKTSLFNLDLVDAISTFSILIPELKNKLDKPFNEIDIRTAMELVKPYREYFEWYSKIDEQIKKETNDLLDNIQEHKQSVDDKAADAVVE